MNATLTPAQTRTLNRTWATPRGLRGWLSTVDHKMIGKRYLVTAFVFLLLGGLEALALRTQLAHPNGTVLSPEQYNELFTMHGVTMIFLYALPILSGFSNYLWPLLIGSRDMAFPRLNALSYWVFLLSGIFIYTSFAVGQPPNGGWFNYVPYTSRTYDPGLNIDFYTLGMLFLGISTTVGSINFVVSLFKMRAPGMSINRLPILVWGTFTASVANLFAVPALTAACVFLFLDRRFGTHFYDPQLGGHPLLWQHLFWMFGHPWVYVIVLPGMGIMSDMIPTFTRRPLVGYTMVAFATVSTGILGFGVWMHHMFATGIPTLSMSFFSAASLVISIPSAVAVFAWIATIYHGRPQFKTPFLFAAGFIFLFVLGGVSGVMTALIPLDFQLTDTYFVVAHLHYVLVGINVFPVIAGLYYWIPKMTGKMLSERIGKWNFWTMFIGFNLGFFPMHIAGLLGMPRRIYTYPAHIGWDTVNMITTIGGFLFALGVLLFVFNYFWSMRHGERAGANPWGAPTLEWAVSSPPPPYNFAVIPSVASRHPLWEDDLDETEARSVLDRGPTLLQGKETIGTTPLDAEPLTVLDMPEDSFAPLLLALSLAATFFALLAGRYAVGGVGVLCILICIVAWLWPGHVVAEPVSEVDVHNDGWSLIRDIPGSSSLAWWGMVWTVITEASLFAFFLFAYFYLGSMATGAWPPNGPPSLHLAMPNTIVLLASSGTLYWAESSIREGNQRNLRIGLLLTFVLGATFLVVQAVEYQHKSFGPGTDAYGSLFFTITGFHAAHVFVGLIMNVFVQVLAWKNYFTAERHVALKNASLYWHFVDGVWIVVYFCLYLTPYFR